MTELVINAVAAAIRKEFGEEARVYTDTVEQGFLAPCFFVVLTRQTCRRNLGNRHWYTHPLDVHYFPVSETAPSVEAHAVAERLEKALELVEPETGVLLRGTSAFSQMIENVLHYFINYDFAVYKDGSTEPAMEKLTVKGGLG